FHEPIVAIGGWRYAVTPPLMRRFMSLQDVLKKELLRFGNRSLKARQGLQVRQGRKVNQTWKSLAESSGNGCDCQMRQGRRAEFRCHEFERCRHLGCQGFQIGR